MSLNRIEALDARRLLAAYAPDVSFGNDGILPLPADRFGNDPAVTLVHEDNNGLVVTTSSGSSREPVLRLERYTLGGKLDSTFTPRDLLLPRPLAVSPFGDRQGRLLLVSYADGSTLSVTRYTADGTLDQSFGKGGTATTAALPPTRKGEFSYGSIVYDVEVTDGPDGSVFITGYRSVSTAPDEVEQHFVYKLDGAGRIDTAFGTNGVLLASTNDFFSHLSTSEDTDEFFFATDPQGRLIVGQTIEFGKFSFTRFTAAGKVDKTYGENGVYLFDAGAAGYSALGYHPAVDAQGRALLLAESSYGKLKLLRLTTDGRLDPAFGDNGVVGSRGYSQALIVQDDGKIVAQIAGGSEYFLRLNADGSRDTTFGADGLSTFVQTENVPEQLNYRFSSTVIKVMTQLADGSYVTSVDTRNGDSIQKMATALSARRGTSGKLYLLGNDGDDHVTVSRTGGGVTRVVFNGRTFAFSKRITGIVAELAAGDNRMDAPVDIPQTISADGGNDTVTTGDADDTVFTRDGNDSLTTNGGYDTIHFYGGDKRIDAGSGSGYITGGPSGNTVVPAGSVRVVGTTTNGSTRGGWKIDVRGTTVSVTVAGGSANIGITATQSAAVDVRNVVSRVSANVSGKRVTFDARRATVRLNVAASVGSSIITGPGNDSIQGGDGADTINGGAGDDRLYGNGGNDSLAGGDGGDLLVAGEGNDTLLGGAGNDRLYAGVPSRLVPSAINYLDGGDGDDRYSIESEKDQLVALEGTPG